jgi:hypothetical protein
VKPERFVGRSVDSLSLKERWQIAGCWVALELYQPDTMPLRIIEAVGKTPSDCIEQLQQRGLDPVRFEFQACAQPYHP